MGALGKIVVPLAAVYRRLDVQMVRAAWRVLSNSPYGARRIWSAYRRLATVIPHGVDFQVTKRARGGQLCAPGISWQAGKW